MDPVKTLANLTGAVVRREGRKFLKLSEGIDEAILTPDVLLGSSEPSLYIHIPFCRSLCPFCCFNRYLFDELQARQYFVNLKRELDIYIRKGFRFSEFYFGGGTPTVLMDELTGFIAACALVRPSRSVLDLKVKSVRKKWKQASFAAGVDRTIIERGAAMLGGELSAVIADVIAAMQEVADDIGLGQDRPTD